MGKLISKHSLETTIYGRSEALKLYGSEIKEGLKNSQIAFFFF
jgi:hypothetical protein